MTISTERLREMLAACEKATPSPWRRFGSPRSDELVGNNGASSVARVHSKDDLSHIANCDPDTVRELLTELLSSRSAGAEGREATPEETAKVTCYLDHKAALSHAGVDEPFLASLERGEHLDNTFLDDDTAAALKENSNAA